jgi:hypothetical protein
MSFWWCGRRINLLQGQGSRASSPGVMMISKMGTSSMPSPSCGGRRHARDLFKNTQQHNLEGGGAVAVGEQPKQALEIPTILCNEDASKLRAVGSCF